MTKPKLIEFTISSEEKYYKLGEKYYTSSYDEVEIPSILATNAIIGVEISPRTNFYKEFIVSIATNEYKSETKSTDYTFGDRVLLVGPTGTGKTHKFHEVVSTLESSGELDISSKITVSDGFEDTDLLAYIIPTKEGGIRYEERAIISVLREASLGKKVAICIDELNRGSKSFMNFILTFLDSVDNGNYVLNNFLMDEKIVIPSENLLVFATMNLGNKYTGTNSVDEALLDRFTRVAHVGYNIEYENYIIESAFGEGELSKVRTVVDSVRNLFTSGNVRSTVSTRGVKVWAERYNSIACADDINEIELEKISSSFKDTLLMRVISMDDYGNPNKDEMLLVMKALKDSGLPI